MPSYSWLLTPWYVGAFVGFVLSIFHLVILILAIGGFGHTIQFLKLKKASNPQIRSFRIIAVTIMVMFIIAIFFDFYAIVYFIRWGTIGGSTIWAVLSLICGYICFLVLRYSNENISLK